MFDMTAPNTKPGTTKGKNPPATPNNGSQFTNEKGEQKDAWFKEEEVMRKKLEKNAIHQLKVRVAQ